ncbi:MAG: DUF3194 domain-containing protein [Candidatus Bathyarchaeota archaeon]|nr:MAG: DUF3194 domain-containing protein [Candidatus Bathyarchaeota archaeon]
MEAYGFPRLNDDQIEALSQKAEEAARSHILSRISLSQIKKLDIFVEAVGTRPVTVTVDIDLGLVNASEPCRVDEVADSAVCEAFDAVKQFLGGLRCQRKQ